MVCVSLASISPLPADESKAEGAQLSATLDPLINNYAPPLRAALSAFGRAVALYSGKNFASALAAFPDDTAAAETALRDQIVLYRAKTDLELDRSKDALELFRSIQTLPAPSRVARDAALGEARALLRLHDPSAALEVLDRTRLRDSAEALMIRGQARELEGKIAESLQAYLRIYADFVNSDQASAAEQRLRLLAPAFVVKAENGEFLVQRAENLVRAGRSADARTLLLKLETLRLKEPLAQKLKILLADADTNIKRPVEALRYLRQITDPAFADQALYLEAVCNRALANETAFLADRDRALREFPQSPYTEKLLYSVATYYDVENEPVAAREAYEAIAQGFPKGTYIQRALWKVALYSYVQKRYLEALNAFGRCLLADTSPGAAAASAYWMGRCCDLLGAPGRAGYFYARVQAISNNSYYGQRAREASSAANPNRAAAQGDITGIDFDLITRTLDGVHAGVADMAAPSGAAAQTIERARQLVAADLMDLALAELERGRTGQNSSDDRILCYCISRIYQSKGNYFGAISSLYRAIPDYAELPADSLPDEIWDILFPVRHLEIVTRNASKNNLDPSLVLALIRQESAFQETARSSANARGLMQVLPSTGRLLARSAGINPYTVARLYHPDTNIALGTRYLASLLQHYSGKVELALAAYNAGDNRVDHWLEEFGDLDMAEFVERIPFSETRGYVKQVMSNLAHYHVRTAGSPGSPSDVRNQ